jgi:hypothetical protein
MLSSEIASQTYDKIWNIEILFLFCLKI